MGRADEQRPIAASTTASATASDTLASRLDALPSRLTVALRFDYSDSDFDHAESQCTFRAERRARSRLRVNIPRRAPAGLHS